MENNYNYVFSRIPFLHDVVQDKKANTMFYIRQTLEQLAEMFEYTGLPDSIPKRYMLLQLFTNGNIFVTDKSNGNGLVSFVGGWGGKPDGYYVPTRYVVANPYFRVEQSFKIGEDGILIYNDSQALGLLPVITRYCELMAENDISLRMASINSRRRTIVSVPDDNTKDAFDAYLCEIENGKLGTAIPDKNFLESLQVASDGFASASNEITALIELQQYTRATMYHALGLNANYNMKRESISANESQLNKDALYPLIDNMLREQQEGWAKVNEMFGTNVSVRFASAWADNEAEKELDLEILENEADPETAPEETPVEESETTKEGEDDDTTPTE